MKEMKKEILIIIAVALAVIGFAFWATAYDEAHGYTSRDNGTAVHAYTVMTRVMPH